MLRSAIAYNVEEESVSAGTDSVMHAVMRHSRSSIGRCQEKVDVHTVPPIKPLHFVSFPLRDQFPVLERGLGMPISNQTGPDVVFPNVLDPL